MKFWRGIISWGTLLGGAAYVRLIWYQCLRGDSHLRFFDPDSLYHLRQIRWGATLFPKLPLIDPYLHFPSGESCPWPGGFDWVLAAFLKIAQLLGLHGTLSEEIFVSTLVSLSFLPTIVLVVLWAKHIWGPPAGWISGTLVALIPALVDGGRFGKVDHHVIEGLPALIGLYPGIPIPLRGILLGISLVSSQSAILNIGLVAFCVLISDFTIILFNRKSQNAFKEAPFFIGSALPLYTLVAATPLVFLTAWSHEKWFDYRYVGLFQLGLIAVWYFVHRAIDIPFVKFRIFFLSIALVLGVSIFLPFLHSFDFINRNPVVALSSETRGAFNAHVFETGYLSDNVYLWPFGCIVLLILFFKKPHNNPAPLHLFVGSVIYFTLTMLQVRFAPQAAIFLAITVGGFLSIFMRRSCVILQHHFKIGEKATKPIVFVCLLVWMGISLRTFAKELFFPVCSWNESKATLFSLMDWIEKQTPDPGDHGDPRISPSYGIMAPWYLGHHLIYLAHRPAISSPFIFDLANSNGVKASIQFYFIDSKEEAMVRLRHLKVRYVIGMDLRGEAFKQTNVLDSNLAKEFKREILSSTMQTPPSHFQNTMAALLLKQTDILGANGDVLKLIHEQVSKKDQRPLVRLFELQKKGSF